MQNFNQYEATHHYIILFKFSEHNRNLPYENHRPKNLVRVIHEFTDL
jgi:hypothetical protein